MGALGRRQLFSGAVGVGVGVPLLAACGGDAEGGGGAEAKPATPSPTAGADLGSTTDVPVGGGVIVKDAGVVVTQPAQGDFKGFSATCTHQGCQLTKVSRTTRTIDCPCHMSKFSIEDGSVEAGPAQAPLPEVRIAVKGTSITVA